MTQSGQGEEPSARPAREGIVLPSDGGAPLLPGSTGPASPGRREDRPGHGAHGGPTGDAGQAAYGGQESYGGPAGHGSQGPYGAHGTHEGHGSRGGAEQHPAAGQTWGDPWGPGQQQTPAPQPGQSWPLPADQQWGASQPTGSDPWGGGTPGQAGPGPLPPESAQPQSYGHGIPGAPLPPADEGATQLIPPVQAASADGGAGGYVPQAQGAGPYGGQGASAPVDGSVGGFAPQAPGASQYGAQGASAPVDGSAGGYVPQTPAAAVDEGATQLIPPVPAASAGAPVYEGATQFLPPVTPGALPPETLSESTHFLGRGPQDGAFPPGAGGASMPMAPGGPDAQATQYIPPVTGQGPGAAPYGGDAGDRQPHADFDGLFRSGPGGGEAPVASTQQMPRFSEPAPGGAAGAGGAPLIPSAARRRVQSDDDERRRGGRTGSRLPLFAAIGVAIAVVGIGAGALLAGGGGDAGDDNEPVSASAPASSGSASASADAAGQQAAELDKLLADSGNSRASVISAVADVKACTNLSQAASDLRDAANQRTGLVTRLSALSVDKLPNHADLTTALTKAWQASAAADNHYAAWADQVAANKKSCRKGQARTTGETQAGNRASGTASTQKNKAAQLWNGIASTYGLTQRQPTQL